MRLAVRVPSSCCPCVKRGIAMPRTRLPCGGFFVAVILLIPCLTGRAGASIIKGTLTFANDAFADQAEVLPTGGQYALHNAATVEGAIAGDDLSSYLDANDPNVVVDAGFSDNQAVNGPGPDLAIFEAGIQNGFHVAIYTNGHTLQTAYRWYYPDKAGILDGIPMNVALVDLSDFGLPAGATVTWILLKLDDPQGADIAGAAAVNSLPEPVTFLLVGIGSLLGLVRRRPGRAAISGHRERCP